MTAFFLKLVNMSISASWLVLAVLVLRLVLKRSPRWISVLLWGIVAVRLLCPFSVESALSLIPSAQTLPPEILSGPSFDVSTGIVGVDERVNEYLDGRYFEGVTVPANNGADTMGILAAVWLAGMAAMLIYASGSYWWLRRRVRTAVRLRENIFQGEAVVSPFVLGIIRPRIYLPFGLDDVAVSYVLAHERAHLRRRDHWWKPLGFLLLAVYWFNSLLWLAYALLCRDIELACDEKVVKGLEKKQRADYSQALVACSVNRRMIAVCPLAFGEVGLRERVRSVLYYKKPAFWVVAVSVLLCALVAVCFLTDPEEPDVDPFAHEYMIDEVIYTQHMFRDSLQAQFAISSDQVFYRMDQDGQQWSCVGAFGETQLNKSGFDRYFNGGSKIDTWAEGFSAKTVRKENQKAWKCVSESGTSYYLLCQKNGDVYLVGLFYDMEGETDPYSDDSNIFYILRLKAVPGLACVAYSGNTEAHLKSGFYPEGFGYYPESLAGAEIDGEGQLVIRPEWEADSLTVNETYCKWDGSGYPVSDTRTYTLDANADGSFGLTVARRGELAGMAYYEVRSEKGTYVFKLVFPGLRQESEKPDADLTPILTLDNAIGQAIFNNFAENTAGVRSFMVTSNRLLAYSLDTTQEENTAEITLYLLVVRQERLLQEPQSIPTIIQEELVPVVITFVVGEDGAYSLKEYWEPQEGEDRKEAVRARFPAEAAETVLRAKLYEEEELRDDCHRQAMKFIKPDIMFRDVWIDEAKLALRIDLCLRRIASSPAYSSNPYDYIDAHPAEFAELVGYGEYMLRYSFGKFLQGGEDGLTDYLMATACEEIAVQWGQTVLTDSMAFLAGQQWFDAVRDNSLRLAMQCSEEELKILYPVSHLLLTMMGE